MSVGMELALMWLFAMVVFVALVCVFEAAVFSGLWNITLVIRVCSVYLVKCVYLRWLYLRSSE